MYMILGYIYQLPIVNTNLINYVNVVEDVVGFRTWEKELKRKDFEGVVVIIQWIFVILLFLLVCISMNGERTYPLPSLLLGIKCYRFLLP